METKAELLTLVGIYYSEKAKTLNKEVEEMLEKELTKFPTVTPCSSVPTTATDETSTQVIKQKWPIFSFIRNKHQKDLAPCFWVLALRFWLDLQ